MLFFKKKEPAARQEKQSQPANQPTWWQRLYGGLGRTASHINIGIKQAIGLSAKLDDATIEALEEVLLLADVGLPAAQAILKELRAKDLPEPLQQEDVQHALAEIMRHKLTPLVPSMTFDEKVQAIKQQGSPAIVLMAGVNGGGKTTTLGKLAARLAAQNKHVIVAAADTFRAGAVAQLAVWAERAQNHGKVEIIQPEESQKQSNKGVADPAGVAYRAVEQALRDNADVVLIDTAGRLPNRDDLMAELAKIRRVIQKIMPDAPHITLLVLDGTQGQAVLQQLTAFKAHGGVDGLIVTKLDGSGKAGFLLPLALREPLPVYALGVGESLEDLGDFDAKAFADGLVGVNR